MYMKSIYLVMSQSGSMLSRTIKLISRKKYSHISISLNGDLNYMYSFGRKHPYNPFIGRFVIEGVDMGTFLRFKNTKCRVIEIKVSDSQYEMLCSNIYDMIENKDKYKYNLIGLFLAAFNVHKTFDNKFSNRQENINNSNTKSNISNTSNRINHNSNTSATLSN